MRQVVYIKLCQVIFVRLFSSSYLRQCYLRQVPSSSYLHQVIFVKVSSSVLKLHALNETKSPEAPTNTTWRLEGSAPEGAPPGFPPNGDDMTTFTSHMCSHLPVLQTSSPPPTAGANGRCIVLCYTRPNHVECYHNAHHVIVHIIPGILNE